METFSALLAICAGNSPVPGEFPTQRPVTRSFDVFFDLRLNKRLSKQSWGWWFETLPCPLWRHSNDGNETENTNHREVYVMWADLVLLALHGYAWCLSACMVSPSHFSILFDIFYPPIIIVTFFHRRSQDKAESNLCRTLYFPMVKSWEYVCNMI